MFSKEAFHAGCTGKSLERNSLVSAPSSIYSATELMNSLGSVLEFIIHVANVILLFSYGRYRDTPYRLGLPVVSSELAPSMEGNLRLHLTGTQLQTGSNPWTSLGEIFKYICVVVRSGLPQGCLICQFTPCRIFFRLGFLLSHLRPRAHRCVINIYS